MKEVNTDRRVLIVIIFTLVLIIISLILGIVNSIFKFESILDSNLIGAFSTFMGALLGAGITGSIAIKIAKIQIEKQQELFRKDKEIENHNRAEKEEKKNIQNHFNQIIILQKIEIELVRIMQETDKVFKQAKIHVMPKEYFQTVTYIKKAKDSYWKEIGNLLDLELKMKLYLFREQYDELVDIHQKGTLEMKDQIELLKIDINALESKEALKTISKKEKIYIKQKQLQIMTLESEWNYYYQEKIYAWETSESGIYYHFAKSLRKEVRKKIIESCEKCQVPIPENPLKEIDEP